MSLVPLPFLFLAIFFAFHVNAIGPINQPSVPDDNVQDGEEMLIRRTVSGDSGESKPGICTAFDQSQMEVKFFLASCQATSCPSAQCYSLWEAKCLERDCPSACSQAEACKIKEMKTLVIPPKPVDPARSIISGQPPVPKPRPESAVAPTATGNSQSDIASCQQLQQSANKACTSTTRAMPDRNDIAGMRAYCAEMQAQAQASGDNNLGDGTTCRNSYKSCVDSCNSMAANYSDGTASTLKGIANSCAKLQSKVAELAQQASSGYESAGGSSVCKDMSNASTQSTGDQQQQQQQQAASGQNQNGGMGALGALGNLGGNNQGSNYDPGAVDECQRDPTSIQCQHCTMYPTLPECRSTAEGLGMAGNQGQSGFDSPAAKEKKGGFDLPDTSEQFPQSYGGSSSGGMQPQSAASNSTVANNSGGAIPGGTGGGAAKLDGGRPGGGGQQQQGVAVEFENGFRSGGFSGYASGNGTGFDSNQDYPQANRRGPASASKGGVDLSKYLPGGELDPHRRLGGTTTKNVEIHGRAVNMFNRISYKFIERCSQGRLDCG